MKKIQMVDLVSQYQKIKSEVDNAVLGVMESSAYINGAEVKSFQKELEEYLNVKHVIPCANGTDALQVALMALNLEENDEIITADFTFASTVEVIHVLKLKSVLVDVDYNDFNIDIEALEKAITPKTKAIIPVHLFGQCANMDAILELAKKHNLYVIEDTAQAIGAAYTFKNGETKKAGTIGDIGTTSFFPSKNLGCFGDGGAIFTNNDDLAKLMRAIVNHGMYERYHHVEVGINSRLDSVQAAILRKKLPHLDDYNNARLNAAEYYNNAFKNNDNIITPTLNENSSHVFHQYTLKITNGKRDHLLSHLQDKGIPCAVYYPIPLRKQKAYDNGNYNDELFPNTNQLIDQVLSLPMHTELEKEQLEFITQTTLNFLK